MFLTGGIPPCITDSCGAERVYECLYKRVMLQNDKYYQRFPQDVALVQRIVTYMLEQPEGGVTTSSGTLVTPEMLQLLGMTGGAGRSTICIGAQRIRCMGWTQQLRHYAWLLDGSADSDGWFHTACLLAGVS